MAVTTDSAGTVHQGSWKCLAGKLQPLDGDGSAATQTTDKDERGGTGGPRASAGSWLIGDRWGMKQEGLGGTVMGKETHW